MIFCFCTGMCSSYHIRSNRITFSECNWLHSDNNKMASYSDRSPTSGVPWIYTRLVGFTILFAWYLQFNFSFFFSFCFLSDEVTKGMIARGRQVKCLWTYAPESEPCSAMHGILWELQRKVRVFHQSAETFWLHNGTIVNRNLVEFHNWKPPMPLPW